MKDFKGKTAFVTGAASGIGLGMARTFLDLGMNVMMADVEEAALAKAAHSLSNHGDRVAHVAADVSLGEAVSEAAARAIERFGKVHVLCNNAGVSRAGRVEEIALADWEWVIGVNLYGMIHGVRAFVPHMRAHGEPSHIVSTSSMSGLTPKALAGPYGATKFAMVGLSHVLRDELAGSNIGVSVLCPGWTRTNMPDNGRNRPARFGGAYDFRKDPLLAARNKDYVDNSAKGLDPLDLAALVVRAIEENEFYIMTEPGRRASVAARYDEIMRAFDAVAERLPRIQKAG
ncbi:MAG TPA: SDR family NAD(P)-dependent oxidoreductase [Xanthobacteraceae bacterium]|nr:SDR family NAD(P)-dependent oxidoreductase [Xanthobacteraceae bacterium]